MLKGLMFYEQRTLELISLCARIVKVGLLHRTLADHIFLLRCLEKKWGV